MITGSGEPDDGWTRADAGSASTIRAVWPPFVPSGGPPLLDPVPPALLVSPRLSAVVVVVVPVAAVVDVVDPACPAPVVDDPAGGEGDAPPAPPALPPVAGAPLLPPVGEPPAVDDVPAARPPDGGAGLVVVGGAAVVVVDMPPPPDGVVFVARTCVGVNGGRPVPALSVTFVPPKTHAVTLPGGGLYVLRPSWLYDQVQVVWPATASACQYDQ